VSATITKTKLVTNSQLMTLQWVPQGAANPGGERATEVDLRELGYVRESSVAMLLRNEAEAYEVQAWRKIDKWLLADRKNRTVVVTPGTYSGWFAAASVKGNPFDSELQMGEATDAWDPRSTKTEALEALATWCEGQK
jgi:hypothetical protein